MQKEGCPLVSPEPLNCVVMGAACFAQGAALALHNRHTFVFRFCHVYNMWLELGLGALYSSVHIEEYALCLLPEVRGDLLVIGALAAIQSGAVHGEGQLLVWTSIGLGRLVVFWAESQKETRESLESNSLLTQKDTTEGSSHAEPDGA